MKELLCLYWMRCLKDFYPTHRLFINLMCSDWLMHPAGSLVALEDCIFLGFEETTSACLAAVWGTANLHDIQDPFLHQNCEPQKVVSTVDLGQGQYPFFATAESLLSNG